MGTEVDLRPRRVAGTVGRGLIPSLGHPRAGQATAGSKHPPVGLSIAPECTDQCPQLDSVLPATGQQGPSCCRQQLHQVDSTTALVGPHTSRGFALNPYWFDPQTP